MGGERVKSAAKVRSPDVLGQLSDPIGRARARDRVHPDVRRDEEACASPGRQDIKRSDPATLPANREGDADRYALE